MTFRFSLKLATFLLLTACCSEVPPSATPTAIRHRQNIEKWRSAQALSDAYVPDQACATFNARPFMLASAPAAAAGQRPVPVHQTGRPRTAPPSLAPVPATRGCIPNMRLEFSLTGLPRCSQVPACCDPLAHPEIAHPEIDPFRHPTTCP
ncbi:hypothetical protein [Sorangium sp. So ce861]|uniref:hypothetical protein n=1 Tax=Sorangium sp. So ce861 TaxID=3133323 RepID=UPI003F62F88E